MVLLFVGSWRKVNISLQLWYLFHIKNKASTPRQICVWSTLLPNQGINWHTTETSAPLCQPTYIQYTANALANTVAVFLFSFDPASKRLESLLCLNNSHHCRSMIQWNPDFSNYRGEEKLVKKTGGSKNGGKFIISFLPREQTIALNNREVQKFQGSKNQDSSIHLSFCTQGFTTDQMRLAEENTAIIEQREKEIQSIVQSISELNEIFRDLATMIVEQVSLN